MVTAIVSSLPGAMADWLTGGILTAILGIVTLWWKIRKEKDDNLIAARSVAVEETEAAIGAMGAVVDTLQNQIQEQSQRITDQGARLTDLATRLTDISRRHEVAIAHIVEREVWASRRWKVRPETLPPIPAELMDDVREVEPSLAVIRSDGPGD